MKKEYVMPEVEIIRLPEDVITTSGGKTDGEYGLSGMPL